MASWYRCRRKRLCTLYKQLDLKGIEFKSNEVTGKYISHSAFANAKKLTNMLIVTNPGKRYSTFIINEKEVEYWANRPKPIIGEE